MGAKAIPFPGSRRIAALAATVESPPDPATSPWLQLAAPVGRVATYFLIGGSFLQLFSPLVFLLDLASRADPAGPGGSLVLLLADPGYLLSIGDFLLILGIVILEAAVFLVLFSFVRADRKVGAGALVLGLVTFACLAAWVPVMLYAQGRATGAVVSVDAAAATGGWGIASVLMLVASLAYLFLCVRTEERHGRLGLPSLRWPIYAAVNVFGAAAIAGFFAGSDPNVNAFSLGLVLKLTMIPMLGVMAFSDLRDRFPAWARVALQVVPKVPAKAAARPRPIAAKPWPVRRVSPMAVSRITANTMSPTVRAPARAIGSAPLARPLPPPPDD